MESTYTVRELSKLIARTVARAFPDEVWVQGEIRDLKRARSGHVYFSLVDPGDDGAGAPGDTVLPVTLFASDRDAVNRLLKRSGAVRMTDGIEVRVRGRVTHYSARGVVQLRMTWIDTEYTIGRLASERDRILRSLAKDNLLEMNRALPVPRVPLRIGLVTSVGSAAHADFLEELRSSGYSWSVDVVDVRVQGAEAERSILEALRLLAPRKIDVVAAVRGGGAQTDLAVFDSEAIARAVARFPKPVFSGIGHEVDTTVLDAVAARSFKTPTACAVALVSAVTDFVAALERTGGAVARTASQRLAAGKARLDERTERLGVAALASARSERSRLDIAEASMRNLARAGPRQAGGRVERLAGALGSIATVRTSAASHELDRTAARVDRVVSVCLNGAKAALSSATSRVEAQDPKRLLARGWSVTRTGYGALVTEPGAVVAGDKLVTTVAGGEIESEVTVLRESRSAPTIEDRI